MKVAASSEIKAPVLSDLPTVQRMDGLRSFQAIALSLLRSSCVISSKEQALITFISRFLDAR